MDFLDNYLISTGKRKVKFSLGLDKNVLLEIKDEALRRGVPVSVFLTALWSAYRDSEQWLDRWSKETDEADEAVTDAGRLLDEANQVEV